MSVRNDGESDVLSGGDPLEVLNAEHFDGIVKVLHRSKTGWLRTATGVYEVRPRDELPTDARSDVLFDLELLDEPDIAIEDLEIDGLELSFGDAVFSLEGSDVVENHGTLQVARPRRLFSKGLGSIVVSPGVVRLRWSAGLLEIRAEVLEMSMDEVIIDGAGPSIVPGRPRPAVIEVHEEGNSKPIELRCILDVSGGGLKQQDYARLHFIVDGDDKPELVRVYRMLRFPQLMDRGALEPEEVVELFERSNYLQLRDTDGGPSEAWCCPDFASDLSVDTVYRADDGTLLGHVSVTRAYSRTWLGHQLATLKGHAESALCRQALYRHFACVPLLSDGENSYLLGYYDRELRWHRLFFESFVDWVRDERHAVVVSFDRFEPQPESTPAAQLDYDRVVISVAPLHAADVAEAVGIVRRQLPDLARRALDIDERHLDLDPLHPEYGRLGVERARHVLALHEGGVLVGVALCETGSQNLSLFNLLNMAQVFVSDERPPSREARAALFGAVRRFYAKRGVPDPVLVAPPGTFPDPADVGLQRQETMGCIIWSGQSLIQYQSFISYCFAKISVRSLVENNTPPKLEVAGNGQ